MIAPAPSPCAQANRRRNRTRHWTRWGRWRTVRQAAWALLDGYVAPGARVAIVGAGNGDDLPLRTLGRRAATLDLIDLDRSALTRARRRCIATPARVTLIAQDVTGGAADAIVAVACGTASATVPVPAGALGAGGYDVVIADHVITQLLFPALADADLPGAEVDSALVRHGQELTDAVVARMHAAAPGGLVIHLHDLLGFWPGHAQPFTPADVLALAAQPAAALALARTGNVPHGCDPRAASLRAGAQILDTRLWRWPFAPGTEYLVCATVTATGAGATDEFSAARSSLSHPHTNERSSDPCQPTRP